MKYLVAVLMLALVFAGLSQAQEWEDNELLVRFKPGAKQAVINKLLDDIDATVVKRFRMGAQHLRIRHRVDVPALAAQVSLNPAVLYAEPNYIMHASLLPNDPSFSQLWGLHNTGQTGGTADADIDAPEAWDTTTGSSQVIVGVIDSGVDYSHPDLAGNMWTNAVEAAGSPGVDDDSNGYIDDIHGYDFYSDDGDPMDANGHGTHVSGTIGGLGNNNVGVVGVNWDVSIMALRFLGPTGSGSTAGAVSAVEYATLMGADLTNNSWGGGGRSTTLRDAIAAGPLFVAASGNSGSRSAHYPSSYFLPNIISVAATDHNDGLASFSNWHPRRVDLGAPGVSILSTLPGNSYGSANGTSMASPHVAGVAALLLAVDPGLTAAEIKDTILATVDSVPSLSGRTLTGGRLNAAAAVQAVATPAPRLPVYTPLVSDMVHATKPGLGAAFPSPANPEVWIPYQLESTREVTIRIHDVYGHHIRTLNLGQQSAGTYDTRSSAAYWDGLNSSGQRVASGTYFYQLQAGDFTATRRLLILK